MNKTLLFLLALTPMLAFGQTKWSDLNQVTTAEDADWLMLLDATGPSNKKLTVSGAKTVFWASPTFTGTVTMPDQDLGDFTFSGGTATLDADVVAPAEMADADHGDFTYSSGVATLDADVVAPAEMADADHGDVAWTSGVATVEAATGGFVVGGTLAVDTITDSTGAAGVDIESVTILAGDITTAGDISVTDLNAGQLIFAEAASVADPTAGYAAFWAKSDTPNTPQFTDDTNTTYQLATLTGTETFTNKSMTGATIDKTSTHAIFTEKHATSHTLTAAECYGSVYYVTAAGVTLTLPAVADGMSLTVISNTGNTVIVDANASDLIILDGTALDDGDSIDSTGAAGDIVVLTYYDSTGWFATSNGWSDGGAS